MGRVTAWLAADPERAEWVRRLVAEAPPMTPEDLHHAQRLLCTPTPAEIAAARRPAKTSTGGHTQ